MKSLLLAALLPAALSPLAAQPTAQAIPLSKATIDLSKVNSHEFRNVAGRNALCLDGVALLREVELKKGAIAIDVAATGKRQFANLIFYAADAENYEEAYLRLHKSQQADAVQYGPVLNGESHWQLFPQHQMVADFGSQKWVTLRVDFAGKRALVTVEGADTTTFAVENLVLGSPGSRLGLASLGGACFSNLRIMSGLQLAEGPKSAPLVPPPGLIRRWALSPSKPFTQFAERFAQTVSGWSTVGTEPDGLLLVSRHRRKVRSAAFEQNSVDLVHAGVILRSDRDRELELDFDASDRARVYLNGRPLYEMNNSFRAKGPLFRGDFGLGGRRLVLPLKRGENRLVIAVADRANGWGLAARLGNLDGVEIEPLRP